MEDAVMKNMLEAREDLGEALSVQWKSGSTDLNKSGMKSVKVP